MARDADDLRPQIDDALKKWANVEARIARASDLPAAVDVYTFADTAAEGIEWAVVLHHADDPSLWFLVPFDQNPLVGTWDVATSEHSEAGPGTLRCGRGIWVHADDVLVGERSGFLEANDIRAARLRLEAMLAGDVGRVTFRAEVDDDPDYLEWLDEVTHAAQRLEIQLQAPVPIISLADFKSDWPTAPGIQWNRPPALAADSGGLAAGPDHEIPPLPGIVISSDLPGVLVAVREPDGVRLLYHPAAGESPPTVRIKSNASPFVVVWRPVPGCGSESVAVLDPSTSPILFLRRGLRRVLSP